MSKQTAVEWLFNKMITEKHTISEWNNIREQAKEMEKEQMISFYLEGCKNSYGIDAHEKYDRIDGENYYNKTYNNV